MNHDILFRDIGDRRFRYAVTGAAGSFARSLLAGARFVKSLEIAALCDLDPERVLALLEALGIDRRAAAVCEDGAAVRDAGASGRIAVVRDHRLLAEARLDIVVEATGQPETAAEIALAAIERGVHVAMVTKECDSVVGPYLNALAVQRGVVYTTADGDQPANLIGLVTWARLLGFEVIAAGKSSEYDFVFDPEAGAVTWTDRRVAAPDLPRHWQLGDDVAATLAARAEALSELPQRATPDYCEMNVVANSTGLLPSAPALSFPVLRPLELADVFIPRADGGILDRTGVVDVFNALRRSDEASFGGGEFVVIRCTDDVTWEMLRGKGHVVSRSGKYAAIYLPYHLMGLETPLSLLSACAHGRASGSDRQRPHALMVARAERDFEVGETLVMGGHHHVMDDCTAFLLPAAEAAGLAPFYLVANKRLVRPVEKGAFLRPDDVDLSGSTLNKIREEIEL